MMKLTVAVLAVALAGTASAAGWRSLRIDGSSEANFAESVGALQKKLPPSRRHALVRALGAIWLQGTSKAEAEQRTYTASEYLLELDGLGYEEVVLLPDPTGKAEGRYRAEFYAQSGSPAAAPGRINSGPTHPPTAFSGSKILDAGQSARAEGRIGGTHF